MGTKVELAGIPIDDCSLAEGLALMEEYIQNPALNLVEAVHMDTIVAAGDNEMVRSCLSEADLAIPSDPIVLQELGLLNEERKVEAEEFSMLVGLLNLCAQKQYPIFLLTEDEAQFEQVSNYCKENLSDPIQICGSYIVENRGAIPERIVNEMNGAAPDVIISMISSPQQEAFIHNHKKMLNARLWVGVGMKQGLAEDGKAPRSLYQRLVTRIKLKRQIESFAAEEKESSLRDMDNQ